MTSKPYEIHITLPWLYDSRDQLEVLAAAHDWHFSCIEGDPDLGNGNKYYFTRHEATEAEAHAELNSMVGQLMHYNYEPIRQKIEHIIFDTKKI